MGKRIIERYPKEKRNYYKDGSWEVEQFADIPFGKLGKQKSRCRRMLIKVGMNKDFVICDECFFSGGGRWGRLNRWNRLGLSFEVKRSSWSKKHYRPFGFYFCEKCDKENKRIKYYTRLYGSFFKARMNLVELDKEIRKQKNA